MRLSQAIGLISDPLDAALTMLADLGHRPHATRSHILALTLAAFDTCATDLLLLTGDGSVGFGVGNPSSTLPEKAIPVAPSPISTLARRFAATARSCRLCSTNILGGHGGQTAPRPAARVPR